ncbi:Transmembrane protein [Trema orientale]|uniref:Transmembrane protein n=1 Tax=Trema orientale TaxID=63057 RepID=A0A2P5FHM0_TREOI|nr:Transmembrane protein [Trema orientale]
MAAAEARAVWQRTANRCFVQEDAKRAPKLACCQSSSTSIQADSGPAAPADAPDHPAVGFMPLNRNPSYSNLPPDTRWWLQMQPCYGYQRGFTYEQVNGLQVEETSKAVVNPTSGISEAHKRKGDSHLDGQINCDFFLDVHNNGAKKKASEIGKQNVKTVDYMDMKELFESEESTESWEIMQMDPVDYPDTKQPNELCLDPEYSWIGSEKSEPWWRMTDRDELVSLVARKSLDHIENCDLPPPQKMCHKRHPFARVGCFDNKENSVSLDGKAHNLGLSNGAIHAQGFADSGRTQERQGYLSGGHLLFGSDETSRNVTERQEDSDCEFSKAQLMEALCHSQTRAREAEKAAKQAYAEKEHIVTLFFRQASLLFAYKQWFQLLQLETLCIQFRKNDQQISTLFPLVLPWTTSSKDRKPRKSFWHKGAKGRGEKRRQPDHDMTKYAVAFALGLSLVGAGLLLGWTVGWMLPHF